MPTNPNPNRKGNILPGLQVPAGLPVEVEKFLHAVKEHLQGGRGTKGQPLERFVTVSELQRIGLIRTVMKGGRSEIRALDSDPSVAAASASSSSSDTSGLPTFFESSLAHGDGWFYNGLAGRWENTPLFTADKHVDDDILSTNVALLDRAAQVFTGASNTFQALIATTVTTDDLTVNNDAIVTGDVTIESITTSVLAVNGVGLVVGVPHSSDDTVLRRTSSALSFGQLTSGMFPNAVVPDAALSSNVPLLNVVNNFQAAQFVTGIATDAQGFAVVGPSGSLRVYPWSSGEVEVLARDAANSAYVGLGIYADSISLSPNSGGLGAVVLAGVAASDFARKSQANTFLTTQTIAATNATLVLRDTDGSGSGLGAYVSFQDPSFERGWIGFGEGNTLMRVVNTIGSLVLQSTALLVVSQESRLIDSAAFLSFYNSGNSTRSGYLQMNAGGNAILNNDVSGGALLLITNGGSVQVSGASETRLVADTAFLSFYNGANSTRRGYLQMITGLGVVLNSEESARDLLLVVNAGRILFSLDAGSSSTAAFSNSGALQVTGTFSGGFLAAQGVEIGVSSGVGYVQSYDRNASAYKHLYLSGDEVYVTKSGGTALVVATQDSDSFTGTLSGFSSTVSGTFEWRRTGNKVTIYRSSVLSGNSNAAGTKTLSGVPAAIQPSVAQRGYALVLTNSNVSTDGNAQISGGNITFSASNGGGFVGSGTEGIAGGFSLTYDLT